MELPHTPIAAREAAAEDAARELSLFETPTAGERAPDGRREPAAAETSVITEHHCAEHPCFSETESVMFFVMWGIPFIAGFVILGCGFYWCVTRSRLSAILLGCTWLIAGVCFFSGFEAGELVLRGMFSNSDWSRLQREIQLREADLERYAHEHPGSNEEIVKGYLASPHRPNAFHFSDPAVPPLHFKASSWRDIVPRIIVGFSCDNNMVFDSETMELEQID